MPFVVMLYAADREHADTLVMHNCYVSRVVGMYELTDRKAPTCPGLTCRAFGWTRHRRGYMVHACGKRRRGWRGRLSVALMDVLGVNLLPRDDTPALFRNPEGWGS
jgi:hypothetical protein